MKRIKKWAAHLALLCLALTAAAGLSMTVITPAEAASVSLNKTKLSLYAGDSGRLTVKGTSKTLAFKSSRPTVASVSKSGTVTAKKAGSCIITVKSGKKTLKCRVTVKKTIELSNYLNKNFNQLKKTAGKMKINYNLPIPNPNENNYISTTKDPFGFMFWADKKTKKLTIIQNTDRKNIRLYGVKLTENITSAHKKLVKKGFRLKKTQKYNSPSLPRKEVRTYKKGTASITISVTKKNKVEYFQWSKR